MTLSDEDYGILYNAIEANQMSIEAYGIAVSFKRLEEEDRPRMQYIEKDQWLHYASFIILSEGRELP